LEFLRESENRSFTHPIGVLWALTTSISIESESLWEMSAELSTSGKIAVQTGKLGSSRPKVDFGNAELDKSDLLAVH
jgi:hypothetical protein